MDDKEKTQNTQPEANGAQAPADALSRTPDDLDQEKASQAVAPTAADAAAEKKPSGLKQLFRKINLYFLLFLLVAAIGGGITIVNYLNSQKEAPKPDIANQSLSEEELKQLANTDTSVGDLTQTLTIKGNAVIEGQALMRGNLNIAGNLQTGGSIQGPSITISGTANLGQAQINSLQVAADVAIQGNSTLRNLNVAGTSSFNGPMTASEITVSKLTLSGNASLQIPNHIAFTGPTPSRSINQAQLGNGGTASMSGSDTAGTIAITTGNSPAAGCMVRVTFAQRFTNQPHVIISPVGSAAGRTEHYVDRDQTGFSVCTASPAPGNQTFAFDYFVMD